MPVILRGLAGIFGMLRLYLVYLSWGHILPTKWESCGRPNTACCNNEGNIRVASGELISPPAKSTAVSVVVVIGALHAFENVLSKEVVITTRLHFLGTEGLRYSRR